MAKMSSIRKRRHGGAIAPVFVLDRREAVPALIGRHEDFLFVDRARRHGARHRRADP